MIFMEAGDFCCCGFFSKKFVILENLRVPLEKIHSNFLILKYLRGGSANPYANIVILKYLKGGLNK